MRLAPTLALAGAARPAVPLGWTCACAEERRKQLRLTITQMVTPRPDIVIAMVEVNAARGGKQLHNHAAHRLFVRGGLVAEWWMVEALPAESDAF
jgi:hypothetical protein